MLKKTSDGLRQAENPAEKGISFAFRPIWLTLTDPSVHREPDGLGRRFRKPNMRAMSAPRSHRVSTTSRAPFEPRESTGERLPHASKPEMSRGNVSASRSGTIRAARPDPRMARGLDFNA